MNTTTQREADEPSLISRAIDAAPEAPKTGDKHSKLPWRITDAPRKIVGADGATVANLTALDLPNAELIVASVNRAAPEAPASEKFDMVDYSKGVIYTNNTTYVALKPSAIAHAATTAGMSDGAIFESVSRRANPEDHAGAMAQVDAALGCVPAPSREAAPLDELFAAIDEAQRMNHYNESSFQLGVRVARLKCLADDLRAALAATEKGPTA